MDPAEVAENRDAWHVLAMECQHTGGLLAEARCALGRGDLAVQVVVLAVVGGGDFGQQACDHLDDVCDGHLADLVLRPDVGGVSSLAP